MEAWLAEAADQFVRTNTLIGQLHEKGFTPISTAPTRDAQVRRDHTLAIIERLASWSPSAVRFPLKVFSTGPVFERGAWAESLDVEVLEDPIVDSESVIFDLLTHLISERFTPPKHRNLVFVAGHLGLLRTLLEQCEWSPDEMSQLEIDFSEGRYSDAERRIAKSIPELLPLFRPSTPESVLTLLSAVQKSRPALDLHAFQRALPSKVDHVPAVLWDLSLTGSFAYYSGLVFSLYARGQGEALIKGGRFSVHYQDRHWQGAGFTIMLPEWFAREQKRGDFVDGSIS